MIRVHTTGRYLVKNGENIVAQDRPYTEAELNGCKCMAGPILLKDLDTRESTVIAPGQEIQFDVEPELTKADLIALMPDKKFPKNITKAKLLEAYHANN